ATRSRSSTSRWRTKAGSATSPSWSRTRGRRSVLVVRLPVAGRDVVLRSLAGSDDILLCEAGAPDLALALALLGQVGREVDGAPLDPAGLPIGDVDVLLLR